MLREANSELEAIYNYYLDMKEDPFSGALFKEPEILPDGHYVRIPLNNNMQNSGSRITYYLIDYYRKNGFPKVLDDNSFRNLQLDNYDNRKPSVIYRGELKNEYARNLLTDVNYHYGYGTYGDGIYATDSFEMAMTYASARENGGEFLELTLSPNAKRIKYDNLVSLGAYLNYQILSHKGYPNFRLRKIKKQYERFPNIPDEVKEKINRLAFFLLKVDDEEFKNAFIPGINSPNALAVYLGYDVIDNPLDNVRTDYIILNRGAICISKSGYDRVMGESTESNEKE